MDKIRIRKVDNYSADIKVNNRTYRVTDAKAKRIRYYQVQGAVIWIACLIIGTIAGLALLGTVGHSDYCVEAGIVDTLTTFDYVVRCSIEFGIIFICYKGCELGRKLLQYNG